MDTPLRMIVGIALAFLLPLHVARAQDESARAHEHQGTATIRGVVSVHPNEESTRQRSRDAILQRYTMSHAPDEMEMADPPVKAVWKRSERVVVYLEGPALDHDHYSIPERHPVLDQKNLEFHPRVLPILVGTTVDFPNRDNLFHNVFSYSQPKEFDLGRYPRNDSRSVTFDQPGVVRVYCDIHAHMNATILVLQNPYFTAPSDNGAYTIQRIPEGRYTLVVWYDREVVERRPVELKSGETVEANFTF